ncbi:MAG TPA: FAD-dependent monooxygenase [Bryobacteraceae bacterium]|nr:FAD-dependent monooxygenase [Bryobacteraceae bacterium]
MNSETSVLIAGAGPTGLTLACDLARRNISFRIVDKAPEYFRGSRAKGMQPRSLEVMHFLGVADRMIEHGRFHLPMRNYENGVVTMERDMYEAFHPTPDTPYASPLMIAQWRAEEVLRGLLATHGRHVELAAELTGIEQDERGVLASITKGGVTEQVRCDYLVGADGGHSFVRKAMGIGFEGETWPNARMYVGDVATNDLDRDHWHCWPASPAGWVGMCPLPTTGSFQFQAAIADENPSEPSLELFQRILDERTGSSAIRLSNATWLSLYRVNIRMVDRYRAGRVFLAGDAAHVHSPAGGQGMNTGIQDAWNLGWKLALVLRGANPALLDTYEEERLPVAANVLGISTRLSRQFVSTGNRFARSAETLQLGISYRHSSLSQPRNSGDPALAPGDRMPDADVNGGRLFDRLRTGGFTLLPDRGALIRPDGYIAWMGEDPAEAARYLEILGIKQKAAP